MSFYPRLYIPVQGNYDRPTWYGLKLKIEEKVVHIAQRNQKRGMKEKSVNREKHVGVMGCRSYGLSE
jgi:hypothetical protein